MIKYILVFVLSVIHFAAAFYIAPPYDAGFSIEQKTVFFVSKILSFALIFLFYNYAANAFIAIKNKNKEISTFVIYACIYFLLNLIVFFLIYPYYTVPNPSFPGYGIDFIEHFLNGMYIICANNIFPFEGGITLFNLFCFSFIFSYCISRLKKLYPKFYYFAIIPFCIPCVFLINESTLKHALFAWFPLLLSAVIYFNQNKERWDKKFAVLSAVLAAAVVSLRAECIIWLIFIPVFIFILKIFSKKIFKIFILVFAVVFLVFNFIQKSDERGGMGYNYNYYFHNLNLGIYNNIPYDAWTEQDKNILRKVYPKLDDYNLADSVLETADMENNKQAIRVLFKVALRNLPHIFSEKFKNYAEQSKTSSCDTGYTFALWSDYSFDIPAINLELRRKIIYILADGNTDESYNKFCILYTPLTHIIILSVILLGGILLRSKFYISYSLVWGIAFILFLIFMPFYGARYIWTFILNFFFMLSVFLLDFMRFMGKKFIKRT